MFRIMLLKLWHKKWMNLCLLLGSILLIATVVSFPIYQSAAYDRMLQDEFQNYEQSEGEWPTMNHLMVVSKKDKEGSTIRRVDDLMEKIHDQLGVTKKNNVVYFSMAPFEAHTTMNRPDAGNLSIRLSTLSDLPAHAKMLNGEMFSESGRTEDGSIEVVISQAGLVEMELLVGETIVFDDIRDAQGNEIKLYIKGVFGAEDYSDPYWQVSPDSMNNVCLMDETLFRSMFTGENAKKYTLTCFYYSLFEYKDIKAKQVPQLIEATDYLVNKGAYKSAMDEPDYYTLLNGYLRKQERIEATLMILQIPVLIMLAAFLFMISGQMYEMERNEISVIKSRGSSRMQIFRLYLYQCFFITLVGGCLGIPLGALFSKFLGSARNFLEFDMNSNLNVSVDGKALLYAGGAMLATLLIMTLPAIGHSRVTIVKLKQQKALKKKSLWEKLFIDIICLGVSIYGYYSFSKSTDQLAESVLMGEALDPLLYISSSLFIVGLGLLFLRLQPRIVQLIYLIGKKRWKPASYASFMENIKNGRKQQFIMLFLIMTISLGMYHATVARTIMQNAENNTDYMVGADIVMQESWTYIPASQYNPNPVYIEPDYTKYVSADWAAQSTKVITDDQCYLSGGKANLQTLTAMGIHTREFGEITWVEQELNEKHYYDMLNALAVEPTGVLLSENFETKLGYQVGDTVVFNNKQGVSTSGKIVGFFSYWPEYASTFMAMNPDGTVSTADNYLLIGHFETLRKNWGTTPYAVWASLKPGKTNADVVKWIQDNDIPMKKYVCRSDEIESTIEDPLLQGTNGVLTMGFIVTLILCVVGYLIYWIMSIRSREMIFGVLRACGMHQGELIHMLMNEQIFSGVFSILAGIGIGKLASKMFVPMLQSAYAAADQVLPMQLIINQKDMMQLYVVIVGAMILCLVILIVLLFKMNVTKALKLGEE